MSYKCGFLIEQDCLKGKCPLRAWVEDQGAGMCIFDISSIAIRGMISEIEKLIPVIKGMTKEQLIQKGIEVWRNLR